MFVASIVPGPSMLLALTHGMKYGAKRTVASALGNLSVTLLQAAISIAGLGAILITYGDIFYIIKWSGAVYLIFMGVSMWRSPDVTISLDSSNPSYPKLPLRKMYLQAALVTAGNPKAIVFLLRSFHNLLTLKLLASHNLAY